VAGFGKELVAFGSSFDGAGFVSIGTNVEAFVGAEGAEFHTVFPSEPGAMDESFLKWSWLEWIWSNTPRR